MSLRIAVLGASGIGRHHAKWHRALGCEVVAFLGSSPASVEATRRALAEAIGFAGRGYTSLQDLLAAESPDAVSVCTPPPLHAEHVGAALGAGCSVLCEKPFVWRPGAATAALVAEAARLVEAAERAGLILAVNTQYVALVEVYRSLAPDAVAAPTSFYGEMTSQTRPGDAGIRGVWLDLAPHPLSILCALLPGARLAAGTLRAERRDVGVRAEFDVASGGRTCRATVLVEKLREKPFPRRFGLNGQVADVEVRPDAQGVFRGTVRLGDRELPCDDFMKTSISRFCGAVRGEGKPLVDGAEALRNLELTLATLDEAERSA